MERLSKEFLHSQRTDMPLALIMVDLDHFKTINDSRGHQGGDQVLREVAEILGRQMRPYDLAARFGGEEFSIILPETDLAGALGVARRLRDLTESHTFLPPADGLAVTASFGVAATPMDSVEALIRCADAALYQAKHNGRNRVETLPS
jgi:diguanylate cyclase (GGDEF)-like protein